MNTRITTKKNRRNASFLLTSTSLLGEFHRPYKDESISLGIACKDAELDQFSNDRQVFAVIGITGWCEEIGGQETDLDPAVSPA